MNKRPLSLIAATALLIAATSSPASAAPSRDRERSRMRERDKPPIMDIIRRVFGVSTTDDLPGPPKP